MPFSYDIQPRLVNVDNPKRGHPQYRARVRGKYHASRMWCPMFYVRERTMLSRTGNTGRLSWQHKGSTTTSKIRAAAKSPKNATPSFYCGRRRLEEKNLKKKSEMAQLCSQQQQVVAARNKPINLVDSRIVT